jgi:hypothetical protein
MKANASLHQIATTLVFTLLGAYASSALAADTVASKGLAAEVAAVGEDTFVASDYKPGLIKHIVLFRYNDGVSADQKKQIRNRFLSLAQECQRGGKPYVISIETGGQNSGEGVDQELEQGFIVTFKSEGDRNYYVGRGIVQKSGNYDPAHDAFKAYVGQYLHTPIDPTGVVVFDFRVDGKAMSSSL